MKTLSETCNIDLSICTNIKLISQGLSRKAKSLSSHIGDVWDGPPGMACHMVEGKQKPLGLKCKSSARENQIALFSLLLVVLLLVGAS